MIKVLHYVAIMNRAGEETFLMNVFRTIDREKVLFDFLCSLNRKGDYDEEIVSLGGKVIHFSDEKKLSPTLFDRMLKLYMFLKKSGKEYKVFHIHTQHSMDGWCDAIVAKICGIEKIVVHSHTTNTLYHPVIHRMFRPLLRRLKIKKYACSMQAGQWLFGRKGNFEVLTNGIITKSFIYSDEVRKRIRRKYDWSGKKIIGHVGSFTYAKNHMFLLEIFRELHKLDNATMLVLVGAGENEEQIRQYIFENDLMENVAFMGIRSDTNELYQGMDMFMFPSKYEGLGIVIVEAQSAALPCLISDVIPNDVDITDYVHRASLELSAMEWAKIAKNLLDADCSRGDISAKICAAGYDIGTTTRKLQQYYINES